MRNKLFAAKTLKEQQDKWCASSSNDSFPQDLALDSLVALLRGHALLNVHCYQVHDLEMMMRLADEFNFKIASFHHGLEAYKIPKPLRERNITVALFSDHWGYKVSLLERLT